MVDVSWVTAVLGLIVFIGGGVTSMFYIRSEVGKQTHEDMESLAMARGQIIEDLRVEVSSLRDEVAEMRGQIGAVMELKAEHIADLTAAKLIPLLEGR